MFQNKNKVVWVLDKEKGDPFFWKRRVLLYLLFPAHDPTSVFCPVLADITWMSPIGGLCTISDHRLLVHNKHRTAP